MVSYGVNVLFLHGRSKFVRIGRVIRLLALGFFIPVLSSPGWTQTEENKKPAENSAWIKAIQNRARALTKNVDAVSKGAKGVGSPIGDRKAWAEIAKSPNFKNVPAEAEKMRRATIPLANEDDYMIFYKIRTPDDEEIGREYERKYQYRRDRLFRLVLAECFENKGQYISDIELTISAICDEPCWSLPQDDPEGKRFAGESKFIDPSTAKTAWNLATVHYWLGRKLSPETRKEIEATVTERVLSVFEDAIRTDHYESIPWANNFGAVNASCHASVIGAAAALIDSAEKRATYFAAADVNIEKFLRALNRDGYFIEGIAAWNEGYGSLILLAETMYQATDGRIDLFKRGNVKEAAQYGARMEITPGVYEETGDRRRGERPLIFPSAFIGKRFKTDLTEIESRTPFFGVGPGDLFTIGICCFPNSATMEKGQAGKIQKAPVETPRSEFQTNQIVIFRSGKNDPAQMGVLLKGGNNAEYGNHNDVGTYVVALGGGKPLVDIGPRFDRPGAVIENRLESNMINSLGHPVPRIDEKLQGSGKAAVASVMERDYTDQADTIKFDLAAVYGWSDSNEVKELSRTFLYDRAGTDPQTPGLANLTVIDRFRGRKSRSFENCVITFGPFRKLTEDEESETIELIVGEGPQAVHITITNDVVEMSKETKKYVRGPKPMVFEAGLLDEPLPGEAKTPFRLSFAMVEPVSDMTMTVKIRPAAKSEWDLAKKEPGDPDKVYTSSIDESAEEIGPGIGVASIFTMEDPSEITDEMLFKECLKAFRKMGREAIASFKQASDEELKTQLEMLRYAHPAFAQLTDQQIDELIRYLKDNL